MMRSHLRLCALLSSFVPLTAAFAAAPAQPLRLAGTALGYATQIEIRDLPRDAADAAIRATFADLAAANAAARGVEREAVDGKPVALDASTTELFRRAQAFCVWSGGAATPLGGRLFALWGLRTPTHALPTADAVAAAVESGNCDRAAYDPKGSTLTVAKGSRLEFYPFEVGWAVDRATALLRQRGTGNFWVQVGPVVHGEGAGPAGRGWEIQPGKLRGMDEPPSSFFLRDRSAALLTAQDRQLAIAGETFPSYLDLRHGKPSSGIAATYVVSQLAIDAQAIAYTMFVLGAPEGMLLVGDLRPRPSIRWYLGRGDGPPVITDVNWSIVPKH